MVLSVPELVACLGSEYSFANSKEADRIVRSRPPKPLSSSRFINFFRAGYTHHELDFDNPSKFRVGFSRLPTNEVRSLYAFMPVSKLPETMNYSDYRGIGFQIANERDIAFDNFGLAEEEEAFYGFLKEYPNSFNEVKDLISRVCMSADEMNKQLVEFLNQRLAIS